jgi:hypothetical protein
MKSFAKFSFIMAVFLALPLILNTQALCNFQQDAGQTQEDETKGLVPKLFVAKRPAVQSNRPTKSRSTQSKKIVYRRITKPIVKPKTEKFEMASLGFTVWKRRAATTDNSKGIAENKNGLTPTVKSDYERVNSETPLAIGENIQITVESLTQTGYLYIIDREKYIDGSFSDPKVIYPIRGRDNYVTPGILKTTGVFDIVASKSSKQQVEEVFTVLLSPTKLIPPAELTGGIVDLDSAKFAEWFSKWKVDFEVIEQEAENGQTMTDEEAKGIEENRKLTQEDPAPATIYRAYINRGSAILFNFPLKFKSAP